jgi:hypothetical protein
LILDIYLKRNKNEAPDNEFINLFENSKMSIISSKSGKSKEGFIPYQS